MAKAGGAEAFPTRMRLIVATLVVVLIVLGAWKVIDYRTQPPAPPAPIQVPAQK